MLVRVLDLNKQKQAAHRLGYEEGVRLCVEAHMTEYSSEFKTQLISDILAEYDEDRS